MFRVAAPPLSVLPFAALCFIQTFLEEKKSVVSMGSWEENLCLLEGKRSLLRVGIFAAPQCSASTCCGVFPAQHCPNISCPETPVPFPSQTSGDLKANQCV